jgi:hypothetical protein
VALISEEYRALNAELHRTSVVYGSGAGTKFGEQLLKLMHKYGTRDVLDYGCGKGKLRHVLPEIRCYDPAIPEFDCPPNPADLVICRDVMEHVEPECVDDVLAHIKSLTKRAAYFVISCRLAAKKLPDGRNTHISVHPPEWWQAKLEKHWKVEPRRAQPEEAEFLCV